MCRPGYNAEAVKAAVAGRACVKYNPLWSTTNSLYSLSLCRDWVKGRVIVLNCDVLAHPDVLTRLVREAHSALAYDSSSGDDHEHMKVEFAGGFLSAMSKVLPMGRTHGENVGILYFSSQAAQMLFVQAEHLFHAGGHNLWLASAVERVAQCLPLHGIDICDLPWIEIDFEHDLIHARSWVGPAIQTRVAPVNVTLAGTMT